MVLKPPESERLPGNLLADDIWLLN